ncbi:GTP binding protein [Toxoplasma gondii CAST]|uniref:GTP binding protein n=1 Tax=Toxoplasma gondii CAST TaxID=943122 RepID=A0A3R8C287_TOXGO|nr:GTP binding protein [Toxoplasma gondii CAST]
MARRDSVDALEFACTRTVCTPIKLAFPFVSLSMCFGFSMRDFAGMLHVAMERNFLYAEGPDGRRLKESDPLTEENNVVRIVTDTSGV